METIVDNFPGQSIDFFGALRSRVYDDKVNSSLAKGDLREGLQPNDEQDQGRLFSFLTNLRQIHPPSSGKLDPLLDPKKGAGSM